MKVNPLLRALGALLVSARFCVAGINFDPSCVGDKMKTLGKEFQYAKEMAEAAKDHPDNDYLSLFFDAGTRANPGFASASKDVFTRMTHVLDSSHQGSGGSNINVACQRPGDIDAKCRKNLLAYINAKGNMYVCEKYFANAADSVQSTEAMLQPGECAKMDIRKAHRTRAQVLVHESAHTEYVMAPMKALLNPPAVIGSVAYDIVYGYTGCVNLAKGTLDRQCALREQSPKLPSSKVVCPTAPGGTTEGICKADLSPWNADNWGFTASATYFSQKCRTKLTVRAMPPKLPGGPAKRSLQVSAPAKRQRPSQRRRSIQRRGLKRKESPSRLQGARKKATKGSKSPASKKSPAGKKSPTQPNQQKQKVPKGNPKQPKDTKSKKCSGNYADFLAM